MKKEVKLGVFVLAALAMAGYFVIKTKSFVDLFSRGNRIPIYARFGTVAGLYPSAPVMLAGVKIGLVSSIGLDGRNAVAKLEIDKDTPLTSDARAIISTIGIVGEKYIEIVYKDEFRQSRPTRIPPGGTILTLEPFNLDVLKVKFDNLYEKLHRAAGDIAGIVADPRIKEGIAETATNLASLSRDLRALAAADGLLPGAIRRYGDLADQLSRTAGDLDQAVMSVSRSLSPAEGEGLLARVDSLLIRLNEAAADLRAMTQKIRAGEGTVGRLVNEDGLYQKIDQSVSQARDLVSDLNRKKEALGRTTLHAAAGAEYLTDQRKTRATIDISLNINNTILQGRAAEGAPGKAATFSVLAGRKVGPLTVSAGLFDSQLGGGMSLALARKRVSLHSYVSQFNREDSPFLRSYLEFTLARHFRFTTGISDWLHHEQREFYLGFSLQNEP